MSSKNTSTSQGCEGYKVFYGVLAGLITGLTIAAVLAFYIIQTPMPFIDRASSQLEQSIRHKDQQRRAPEEPNTGLQEQDRISFSSPSSFSNSSLKKNKADDMGAMIAILPSLRKDLVPPPSSVTPMLSSESLVAMPLPNNKLEFPPTYYLQAGAYRGEREADSMKARITLLGLPVTVQKAENKGHSINRVRVGPFSRLEELTWARDRLDKNKIETTVFR